MLGIYCRTNTDAYADLPSIMEQKTAGIKFAEDHNFEYKLYKERKKPGFTKTDDGFDPFDGRPSFMNLINDIKNGIINSVWVSEDLRLSKNPYTWACILGIFKKHKIALYVDGKEFDMYKYRFRDVSRCSKKLMEETCIRT